MIKTITFEEFRSSDFEEVNSEPWRHGRRAQYLVREDDGIYLTGFMDVTYDDGIQNYDDKVRLYPAVQVMKPAWEIVK